MQLKAILFLVLKKPVKVETGATVMVPIFVGKKFTGEKRSVSIQKLMVNIQEEYNKSIFFFCYPSDYIYNS